MPYIPNSPDDQKKMLERIGARDLDELFQTIPENLRLKDQLDLPPALSEPELIRLLEEIASRNRPGELSFMGGGIYRHFIPPVIWSLVMRPEFATAYTPYQGEVAQGTLQIIYEFQTHICRLTGMEVANASMYDGATALAEAAILALSHKGGNRVVVSETINPVWREVLRATLAGRDIEIVTVAAKNGLSDFTAINDAVNDKTACLMLAQPNFYGYLEDIEKGEAIIRKADGLLVMAFDPISLGLLKTPAEYGADIAVAEGQSLGIPQNFGGPLVGLFACRREFVRKLPGRLVGRTVDIDGKTGFVLTLQTREQHIRRDKATSNICTNEALCATAATIYLSLMGKKGLPQVARLCLDRAHYLADKIASLDGYHLWQKHPFFKEFVVETPVPAGQIISELDQRGIAAGIDLNRFGCPADNLLLVAVTELITPADCDCLAKELSEIKSGTKSSAEAAVK